MSSNQTNILIPIFPGFDTLDLGGPVEVFGKGGNFVIKTTGIQEEIKSVDGITIKCDLTLDKAYDQLSDFHILIQPGAGLDGIKTYHDNNFEKHKQLLQAFAVLGPSQNGPRVIMSICTGALLLASAGVFAGLQVTTHYEGLELLQTYCNAYQTQYGGQSAQIIPTLEGGSKDTEQKRMQEAYRGAQRSQIRWVDAGQNQSCVRVISSGGISCGIDASLFLLAELRGVEKAHFSARIMEYAWRWA